MESIWQVTANHDRWGWWYEAQRMERDGNQLVKAHGPDGWLMNGPCETEAEAYDLARADLFERGADCVY